jgi:hypothetical protein
MLRFIPEGGQSEKSNFSQLPHPPPEIVGEDYGRLARNQLGSLRAQ